MEASAGKFAPQTAAIHEVEPCAAGVWKWLVGLGAALSTELLKERDQLGMEWRSVQTTALDGEANQPALAIGDNVHISHRVDEGFAQAASLVAGDLEAV